MSGSQRDDESREISDSQTLKPALEKHLSIKARRSRSCIESNGQQLQECTDDLLETPLVAEDKTLAQGISNLSLKNNQTASGGIEGGPKGDSTKDEQEVKMKKFRQSILLKISHLLPKALLKKSDVCQHHFGCFENVVRQAFFTFIFGFGLQFAVKNILNIFRPLKILKNLVKVKMLQDCSRFGLFLMCIKTGYKFILCLLRRLGSLNDRVNAPIAGFLSALTLAFDVGHRRELLTTLMMSRAIDSSIRMSESSGVIPKVQSRDFILWMFANVFIQSLVGFKQGVLNKGVRKFYVTWAQMKENDKLLVDVWHRMLADGIPTF